jgi:hypothetical protein
MSRVIHYTWENNMDSSEDLAGIRRCFEELKHHSVDPHNYKGLLFDVVFEIITADTYIAGIASKILDGEVIEAEERFLLGRSLLADKHRWQRPTGEVFDLQDHAEIGEYAIKVESLREKCHQALAPPTSS